MHLLRLRYWGFHLGAHLLASRGINFSSFACNSSDHSGHPLLPIILMIPALLA
jgi:hypothetical protein